MPLRIIIDGYNLIGIAHKDLKKQRGLFIDRLVTYKQQKGHKIIVVFDGHKSGRPEREIMEREGVKIIYTRIGETTDEFIEAFLKDSKTQWIVISSDHSIQKEAWRYKAIPVRSEDFEQILERTLRLSHSCIDTPSPYVRESEGQSPSKKPCPQFKEEELWAHNTIKGKPRQPSKRERLIMRVLERL